MVLRKPYAFFIKHFRFIHVVLSFLMLYLIYFTKRLLDFLNKYITDNINLKGQELASIYTPFIFKVLPLLIIVLLIIILVVMILKKKPKLLYIINIASNIYTFIIIQIASSTLKSMESSMLDVRASRLIRDIIMISFLVQLFCTILVLIRSVGFDIKKFDFKQDLKELEINEEDREEFELEFSIDKNKTRRNTRRRIRFLKYAYKENKLFVNIAIASFIVLISLVSIYIYYKSDKPIYENMYASSNGITLKINKSYITNTDYKGNILDEDSIFIVLNIDIKSDNSNNSLDIATTKIKVGDFSYIPIYDYKLAFLDFGNIYLGDKLSNQFEQKILVYQIPKQFKDEKITFEYVNKLNMSKKIIKLNLIDLTQNTTQTEVNIKDKLDFSDSILSSYSMTIDSIDINTKYKLEYNFCYNKTCKKSYEYLVPSINSNQDKTILKINGSLQTDNIVSNIKDLADIIENFGKIYYTIDGNKKVSTLPFKQIVSSKKKENNIFYIEVPKEIENATNISLKLKIRNKNYEYILK